MLWFLLGISLLVLVIDSALRTFVLPLGAAPILTRTVFVGLRAGFNAIASTTSGAVLDAASLRLAAVDMPFDPQAGLCVRGGFFSLVAIAEYFGLPFAEDPAPSDPISVTKDESLEACDELVAAGIPVRQDRDVAWVEFAGWRVNYDQALIGLAGFVMAPYAPWSPNRSLRYQRRGRKRGGRLLPFPRNR